MKLRVHTQMGRSHCLLVSDFPLDATGIGVVRGFIGSVISACSAFTATMATA
jgi:hypothetical protein